MGATLQQRINQLALAASLVLFAAIGALWWHDRSRVWETPRFDPARFAPVAAPESSLSARPRFVVAVHPGCSHCRERLVSLTREGAAEACGAVLAALLVDVEPRPERPDLGVPLAGGVWWDSAGVWRNAWGRRVYGETFVFSPDGTLERVIATDGDWRVPPAR